MNFNDLFPDSQLFAWVILPVLIFFARIADVTLGTLRIVFVSRGQKMLAPLLGFFEVLIWILAISQILTNISNFAGYVAYAAGFAAGNYVGLIIENKLAIGTLTIRMFVLGQENEIVEKLHDNGYGVTQVDAVGTTGNVKLIFTIIKRKDLKCVEEIIRSVNPHIFYSVEETRHTSEGVFPPSKTTSWFSNRHLVRSVKK